MTVDRVDLATGVTRRLGSAARLQARSLRVSPFTGEILLSALLQGEADLRLVAELDLDAHSP